MCAQGMISVPYMSGATAAAVADEDKDDDEVVVQDGALHKSS